MRQTSKGTNAGQEFFLLFGHVEFGDGLAAVILMWD